MPTITPLKNRVIVKLEGSDGNKLGEYKSDGGIVVMGSDLSSGFNLEEGLKDRWAIVIATGKDVEIVEVGERVMIENGKWTEAMKLSSGEHVWMTEDKFIMVVDDSYVSKDK